MMSEVIVLEKSAIKTSADQKCESADQPNKSTCTIPYGKESVSLYIWDV